MLPDGAHLRPEDWTVFYLGQTSHSGLSVSTTILEDGENPRTSSNRRASMVASPDRPPRGVPGGGLLYVLNCVRMKEDKSVRRGAMVKAMAVCSPFPYIGIFKVCHALSSSDHTVLARYWVRTFTDSFEYGRCHADDLAATTARARRILYITNRRCPAETV